MSSPPVFSGIRLTRSLVLCVCFVDRCSSFCTFSFGHCVVCSSIYGFWINIREYQRVNQKGTIQRNWQHSPHKTKKNKTKTHHNMCRTPLHSNKHKQRKQDMIPLSLQLNLCCLCPLVFLCSQRFLKVCGFPFFWEYTLKVIQESRLAHSIRYHVYMFNTVYLVIIYILLIYTLLIYLN